MHIILFGFMGVIYTIILKALVSYRLIFEFRCLSLCCHVCMELSTSSIKQSSQTLLNSSLGLNEQGCYKDLTEFEHQQFSLCKMYALLDIPQSVISGIINGKVEATTVTQPQSSRSDKVASCEINSSWYVGIIFRWPSTFVLIVFPLQFHFSFMSCC